jgi:hypothetical protein
MMHGLEKSDSLVVPMKLANKAGFARGGVNGGKRWDRKKWGSAKHGPTSESDPPCHRRRFRIQVKEYTGTLSAPAPSAITSLRRLFNR